MQPTVSTGSTVAMTAPVIQALNGVLVQAFHLQPSEAANWVTLIIFAIGLLIHNGGIVKSLLALAGLARKVPVVAVIFALSMPLVACATKTTTSTTNGVTTTTTTNGAVTTSTTNGVTTTTVNPVITDACAFVTDADATFKVFATNHQLGIGCAQVKDEAAAMTSFSNYCANPASVTNVVAALAELTADAAQIAALFAPGAPITCITSP